MRKVRMLAVIAAMMAVAMPTVARGADEEMLPNLQPLPAFQVNVGRADWGTSVRGLAIRFSVSTYNDSAYALDLLGAPPRDAERTIANQCVRWAGRACLERREAGDFVFHAEHGHWHLEDYALYELRRLLPNDEPDMSPTGLAASGGKVSFCLIDYARPGPARPVTEDPFDQTGFYLACQGGLQGISPGWSDIYGAHLAGQQIVHDGVPDGRYAIVVTVDPDGRLFESDRTDNVSVQRIEVLGNGSSVIAE
jgi:hypothetical protein